MEKVKKIASFFLAMLLTMCGLLMAACATGSETLGGNGENGGDEGNKPVTPPVTVERADNNVFLIGSWVSYYSYDIDSHETQMKRLSEAGVNFNCFPSDYDDNTKRDSLDDWLEIDALCEKYGMFYNLSVDPWNNCEIENMSLNLDIGEKLAERGKGKYMLGYHLWDEPFYNRLDEAADWFHKYLDEDPDHPGFVNLNGSSGVAGVDMYCYAKHWMELSPEIMFLGYDLYPFANEITYDANKYLNMEVLRKVALEAGNVRTHAFVQSTGWTTHRMPNFGEISWDAWGLVAYGFKAFSYFNYVCPSKAQGEGFFESLINDDGTIPDQQLFDDVADMNWKIRAVGDVLMNYDAVHAYHSSRNYTGVEYLPSDYFITTNQDKVVISYFEPKDGTSPNHIMLFNNSWTDSRSATFSVDQNSGLTKLEYFNPETKRYENVDISSGSFDVNFATGEAKLYRIRGNVQG